MDPVVIEEGASPQLNLLRAQIAALQSEYDRLQEQAANDEPHECNIGSCPLPDFHMRDEAILDLTSSANEGSRDIIDLTQVGRGVDAVIDKDTLKAMLRREHELRHSPATQKKYAEAEKMEVTDWMDVTIELQKQVVREFGLEGNMESALLQLRTAARTYPDDPDFRELPLYVKYQRSRAGHLKPGDSVPDIMLMKLDGALQRLKDLAAGARPLVLLAGSMT
ncbi:hypothetical protein KFL_002200060 [Klebsormidium nitens]|uniref:Uncharacterized protein n=1 Tax=Klebsormidium nitens TaxID=105231 RepID=A0A1Y1I2G6_KLENI|nr:hypothetical protein KFL_002200060 [Klebsormidium nitens]|eukprot:GAQ85120.1 hypothetical protein KFL_002200060 [Klebsormidium nitens]